MKAIVHTDGYHYVRDLFCYPGKFYPVTSKEYKRLTKGRYTISIQKVAG
jgi:hypothetical protein